MSKNGVGAMGLLGASAAGLALAHVPQVFLCEGCDEVAIPKRCVRHMRGEWIRAAMGGPVCRFAACARRAVELRLSGVAALALARHGFRAAPAASARAGQHGGNCYEARGREGRKGKVSSPFDVEFAAMGDAGCSEDCGEASGDGGIELASQEVDGERCQGRVNCGVKAAALPSGADEVVEFGWDWKDDD